MGLVELWLVNSNTLHAVMLQEVMKRGRITILSSGAPNTYSSYCSMVLSEIFTFN
jgi:hypothetical protein